MDNLKMIFLYSLPSFIILLLSIKYLLSKISKRNLNLPPSPPGCLPFIGHLHLIKLPVHRTLHSLGGGEPIFSIRLGSRLVYVVSAYSIAEECFTKNDVILANRPPSIGRKHLAYNSSTMVTASYGDHWRNIRRIGAIEVFSSHRLNGFSSIRKDEIRRLIIRLSRKCSSGSTFAKVEMSSMIADLTLNNIMRIVTGKRYDRDDVEGDAVIKRVSEIKEETRLFTGAANPGDYLPIFNWVTNFEKNAKRVERKQDSFFEELIDEKRSQPEKGNTMIDHLLSLQESEPEYYTDKFVKGFLLVMIFAGMDTSIVTMELVLSNLLNHPDMINKARAEIEQQIGYDRLIDEADLSNLPYIRNIISESLRLHPSAPLLVPHMASQDCIVAGYDMPRDTILLVNAWAVNRDTKVWDDPDSFKPERFENDGEIEKLISFGLGRRACPGSGMALRILSLALGSLIQCFEWKRVGEDEVDMKEGRGITMSRTTPLEALCKARPIVGKILSGAAIIN